MPEPIHLRRLWGADLEPFDGDRYMTARPSRVPKRPMWRLPPESREGSWREGELRRAARHHLREGRAVGRIEGAVWAFVLVSVLVLSGFWMGGR